jgi:hypothetical protein
MIDGQMLSDRAYRILEENGISTLGELKLALIDDAIVRYPACGRRTLIEYKTYVFLKDNPIVPMSGNLIYMDRKGSVYAHSFNIGVSNYAVFWCFN